MWLREQIVPHLNSTLTVYDYIVENKGPFRAEKKKTGVSELTLLGWPNTEAYRLGRGGELSPYWKCPRWREMYTARQIHSHSYYTVERIPIRGAR
jgi:hypothetical protein